MKHHPVLPKFLVIGAMKAGTTTMYEDLRAHPAAFLPEKELSFLREPDITSPQGRARYERLFRSATPSQVVGEVSSPYAKLPESDGTVERAAAVLGNDFKVVYLVRDPVDRVVSQHHHELSRGRVPASVDQAVREVPRLIGYSKYAAQLRPWAELVGPRRVRVVKFEDYVRDRQGTLRSLYEFLDMPEMPTTAGPTKAYNVSARQPVAIGRMGTLARSHVYRSLVRPILNERLRRRLSGTLLPPAPTRPAPPTMETVDAVIEQVGPELAELARLCDSPPLLWDLEATRRKYQAPESTGRE